MVSCRSTKTVTRDTYSLTNTTVHDTQVRFRDSYHVLIVQGDTVYQRDSIHDQIEIEVHDTVYIADSTSYQHIEQPAPVVAHEREPLTKVQRFFLRSGIALWCILLLLLIGWIIKKFVL